MEQMIFSILLSTVPAMLQKVDELQKLAEERPSNERTLAACMVVMLAEVLEQGTSSILDHMAFLQATDFGISQKETPSALLRKESVRQRMLHLPSALSLGEFELDTQNQNVKSLHDLITLRNSLMHVQEGAHVGEQPIEFDDSGFVYLNDEHGGNAPAASRADASSETNSSPETGLPSTVRIRLETPDGLITVEDVPIPKNPWFTITLKEARTYCAAVQIYESEIFSRYQNLQPGVLVIANPKQ